MKMTLKSRSILVCQAGSCRQAGSAAVLVEIEELAKSVGGCRVEASGCLGLCDKAPGVAVLGESGCEYHPSIIAPELSAVVVEKATGKRPDLNDPELMVRLSFSRIAKGKVIEAQREYKWNLAVSALKSLTPLANDEYARDEAYLCLVECLEKAGRFEDALEVFNILVVGSDITKPIEKMHLMLVGSNLMAKAGNQEAAIELVTGFQKKSIQVLEDRKARAPNLRRPRMNSFSRKIQNELFLAGKQLILVKSIEFIAPENRPISNYYPWCLSRIEAASEASAIYSFSCFGVTKLRPKEKRRISGEVWRTVNNTSCLWHTTLLAHAPAGTEGPCPWVERDYTPISTFGDWVLGKCDLLIKAYPDGKATQWLKRQAVGALIHLSEPKLTEQAAVLPRLAMPRLLFIVGGTGVAVAVQALRALADSHKPVSVVYSCRADDALALDAIEVFVAERAAALGGLSPPATSMHVLLTAPADPVTEAANLAARHPSIRFSSGRLNRRVLALAIASVGGAAAAVATPREATTSDSWERVGASAWAAEVGIIVSGPAGMNSAVRSMLDELGFPPDAAAILQS
jgi:pentatricopeptide repeat protein